MNIREEIEHCIDSNSGLSGFNKITEYGIDVLEGLFKKLAKQVCDKQKKICVDNASVNTSNGDCWNIDEYSILNSPYPEELQ